VTGAGATLGHAAISDGAVDAAILHGCGHERLAELRNAIAYSVATRCAVVFDLAAEAGIGRGVVECGQALLANTMVLPFDDAVIRLDDPSLRTWLADAERSLARTEPALATAVARFGWVLLADVGAVEQRPVEWPVALPSDGRVAAIGLAAERLRADQDHEAATVTVESGGETLTVRGDAGALASLRRTATGLTIDRAAGFLREPRRRTVLGIELVAVADFPELARHDVDTGLPLESSTHSVDGSLAEALALIAEVWPESVVDVLAMVRSIVALTAPPGHIYNTSSGQTPSVVQLTIRPDEDAFCLAETIVHEAAHVKLDAVWDLEPLLIDDGTDRHRHPWLPDLRPLRGALLGAQAFLNVSEFDRRAAERGIDAPYAAAQHELHRNEVVEALALLDAHAELSPLGTRVFERLHRAVR
jgi:HEXXH motif-containing protein